MKIFLITFLVSNGGAFRISVNKSGNRRFDIENVPKLFIVAF